jgi:hypothetical protein
LDIDLGRGCDDDRRVGIGVPVRAHEGPEGEHNARPDEDTPMMDMVSRMEAMPMMEAMSTEGIPW